jgi:hypothetical protein
VSIASLLVVALVGACDSDSSPRILNAPSLVTTSASLNLVSTSIPPTTLVAQELQLLAKVNGVWTGPAGRIDFKAGGETEMTIRDCPLLPNAPKFGYNLDCDARSVSGRTGYGSFEMVFAVDPTLSVPFSIYVDGDGHLHVGSGYAFTLDSDRRGTIGPPAGDYLIDGDVCTEPTVEHPDGVPVPCTWQTIDGLEVLTIRDQVFIRDPVAHVMASPALYFNVFTQTASTPVTGTAPH